LIARSMGFPSACHKSIASSSGRFAAVVGCIESAEVGAPIGAVAVVGVVEDDDEDSGQYRRAWRPFVSAEAATIVAAVVGKPVADHGCTEDEVKGIDVKAVGAGTPCCKNDMCGGCPDPASGTAATTWKTCSFSLSKRAPSSICVDCRNCWTSCKVVPSWGSGRSAQCDMLSGVDAKSCSEMVSCIALADPCTSPAGAVAAAV